MPVNEEDVVNIMGGMEHAGGIKLNDHKRKLKNRFELCKKLGQGTYGKVQLGINKETGQRVAIKTIKKSKIETEADLIRIRREIQIMSSVQHPNIIHIYEVFENKEKMVLVMEIAAGGELYDYISDRKTLGEVDARRIFRQISTAIYYCHKHNICHRDLKLENILLDEDGGAKIADFGLSNVFDRVNLLKTFCGSPLYASPEIVLGCPYKGPEVDCWSLGVLLYTLVYGAMPFDGSNMKLLVRQIREGNIYEPKPPSSASSLIRWMLTVKAENRASIVDICNHWWINEGYDTGCLEEAEYLASLTPVRLDLLLSLNKQEKKPSKGEPDFEGEEREGKETPSVDIEEMPADTPIPDGMEECDVSVSEEPDESPRRRRKKEKRKLESSSTGGDAQVPKKHERNDDLPLPPAYERAPEPMEEEQVYERPRERRKEDGRTPRVRRKHKSNEDVLEETNTGVTPEVQRKPPHKPRTAHQDHHDHNGDVKKKSPRKEKRNQENGSQAGFERPVPCASPRPPRTPPPPEWNEQETIPQGEDSVPPPLPEKKRKSPGHQSDTQSNTESRLTQPQTESLPSHTHSPEETAGVQTDTEKLRIEEDEKNRTLDRLVEAVQNGFASVQTLVQSLPVGGNTSSVPPSSDLMETPSSCPSEAPVCDQSAKDNFSVIIPEDNQPVVEEAEGEARPEDTRSVTQQQEAVIQASHQVSPPVESVSGVCVAPAGNHRTIPQCCVGESGGVPALQATARQSQDHNLPQSDGQHSIEPPPVQSLDIHTSTSVPAPSSVTEVSSQPGATQKENAPPPLVKPFPSQPTNVKPLEFPPKGVSSPEPTSIKPPWVKGTKAQLSEDAQVVPHTEQNVSKQVPAGPVSPVHKEAPALPASHPKKEASPPSQSPKQKAVSVSSVKHKETTNANNLPKLKIIEAQNVDQEQEQRESSSQSPSTPLVVPFPGRSGPSQLVKQDSPKSLINNIPKPFKVEMDKSADVAQNNIQIIPAEAEMPSVTPLSVQVATSSTAPDPVPPSNPASPPPVNTNPPTDPITSPTPARPPAAVSLPNPAPVLKAPKTPGLARSSPRPAQPIQYSNGTPRKSPITTQVKVESSPPSARPQAPKFPTASRKGSTDSVGSAISLSSDGDHRSTPPSPMILPKPNGPNINLATLSPSNSGGNIDPDSKEKSRDSKVIKAAAYWNNYIGEVKSKARPPANPKLMEKPKKIVSAGIGENAMKDMTKAFESGKPSVEGDKLSLLRRNSKKMSVESCNPGLRVNDAKSHFEKKAALQQPAETPRMTRRASGTLEKPVSKLVKNESGSKCLLKPGNASQTETPSKSPSPSKSDTDMTPISKSKSKSRSPVPTTENLAPVSEPKHDVDQKPKQDVQRNAVAAPLSCASASTIPTTAEHMTEPTSPKPHLELLSAEVVVTKDQQPKPPTSPKPKVRKEELKLKEEEAKREDKPRPQLVTRLKGEQINMVAPLSPKANEKEMGDKALVKTVKNEPSKPTEFIEPKHDVNHNSPSEQKPTMDNNEVKSPTSLVKPILRDKSRKATDEGKPKETFIECRNVTKDSENGTGQPKLVIKTVKIKSPEPEKTPGGSPPEQRLELSDVRNSLKKVPHVAVARRRSFTEKDEGQVETVSQESPEVKVVKPEVIEVEPEVTQTQPKSNKESPETSKETESVPKERIIPIQFVNENRSMGPKPFKLEANSRPETPTGCVTLPDKLESPQTNKKHEHHIPIVVEGKSSVSNRTTEEETEQEKLDNFNASSISRHRWGSRKKRMSSAFSDSSMSDDEALNTPFGGGQNQGLQKYSSYGKHGPGEVSNYALKKTRPPFSVTRQESFSSGEDDGLDDDNYQEISAENLFSTLLSRVKSLTRRIHDEHDEHINWQQKQRHGPPKLNPGGTHARLERTAQRNSIKRDREPVTGDGQASYSRQSSTYSKTEDPGNYSNTSSLRSSYGNSSSNYEPRKIYNRSNSGQSDPDSRFSTGSRYSTADRTGKRYEEPDTGTDLSSSVSVSSCQRLRPGYLPPPANTTHNTASIANSSANTVDPMAVTQTVINRASDRAERSIPINIQREDSGEASPVSSKPGTPLPTPGNTHNTHMKPFSPTCTNESSRNHSRLESPEPLSDGTDKNRRVSRFLRPDFYETPKEDSIYAKMRELDEDEKKMPRYLRGSNITRTTKSGRSTPHSAEDRSKSDSLTPRPQSQEHGAPLGSEGSRQHIRSLKKKSIDAADHDQDILMAGVNKLRREGMQRSTDVSEISDGFKTPEDTESITSDIFGVPDFVREGEESFNDRLQRSGYLGRVDENSCSVSSSSSRPARRSTTNELFDERPNRYTGARPVARRSVSRELFDLKYGSGATSPSPYSSTVPESDSTVLSPRHTRYSREGSSSRDSGLDPSPYSSSLRSSSISRPEHLPRPGLPSRPGLASGGRSNTQAEILRQSPLGHLSSAGGRYSASDEERFNAGSSLRDRKRDGSDWRRISVPERGKDFNSLPRKYNSRLNKNSYI